MSEIKRNQTRSECLFFNEFIAEKEASGLSKHSIDNYQKVYSLYINQIGQKISRESINEWIHMMIEKGMNPISINFYITQIKVFANWLMKNCYYSHFEIKKLKTQEPQLKTISDEDINVLLEKPSMRCRFVPYRCWVIINFILGTGARASTLMNLRVDDIDFSSKEIRYTHLKNKSSAIVPLSKTLERVLKLYLSTWDIGHSFLFPDKYGGQLTLTALEHSLKNYVVSRGLKYKGAHSFRHTFAKKYIVNGGNAFVLQRLLTHSDLSMTKKYVRLFSSDLHKDYDTLCPLDSYDTHSAVKRKCNIKSL